MKKYRILKNKDHYIIQKKGIFFWRQIKEWTGFYGTYTTKHFVTLMQAQEYINKLRELDDTKLKRNSKYKVVTPIEDTPLGEVIYNTLEKK